ncbi:MAG: damage-inducible protein DinB [Ignavibacteria bacterium]|nr:damage-inducible protein DinB [Ignavibacteria bacterium]
MKEKFTDIFDYELWANNEFINIIESMDSPPDNILNLMSHIINAQVVWLCRIKNVNSNTEVWQKYSKDDLRKIHTLSINNILKFINDLGEEEFEKNIEYENSKGEKFSTRLKDILIHMSHHSAYHRGQLVLQLKSVNTNFPYTDYIHFIRKIKQNN